MARFTLLKAFVLANVALFASAASLPRDPTPVHVARADITAAAQVNVGTGSKFITEACANDGECASGCCGFNSGKCAGGVIAQERDGGCGHGDATPNNNAAKIILGPNAEAAPGVPKAGAANNAAAPAAAPPTPAAAAPANDITAAAQVNVGTGTKFITEACANDGECASGCCGFNSGKCAGGVIAQERDGGCGHGNATPNNDAAKKILGPNAEKAPGVLRMLKLNGRAPTPVHQARAVGITAAAQVNVGTGSKFITEACANDGECASGCCGFNSGKCAGGVIAQERDGGCGHGNATPNNDAAKKILGPNAEKAPGVP